MFLVVIDEDKCQGCGDCVNACPAKILAMVDEKACVVGDSSECLGCESCVVLCANGSVTVTEY